MPGRYKIKSVSDMTGFSPTLLRAWERRHELLEPERQPSGHRLYTDDDLSVLRQVRRLIDQGHSIGEIAAIGRPKLLERTARQGGAEPSLSVSESPSQLPNDEEQRAIEELRREIVAGVVDLDVNRTRAAVARAESALSPHDLLYSIVMVTSKEVGYLWANGRASVASEHLLSSIWTERLRAWIERDGAPVDGHKGRVFCAGFPDELHELGMLVLVYELRRQGREVIYLGACLPFEDLERAIAKLEPRVVCLSVTRQPVFEVHRPRFSELVARQPQVQFVLGGSGVVHLEAELTQMGVLPWPPYRPLSELGGLLP